MPHYVANRFIVDPGSRRRVEVVNGVCGHTKEHAFDLSDVASLIDCEACRNWIRRHEQDAHRLKLIENAWAPPDQRREAFYNTSIEKWDLR